VADVTVGTSCLVGRDRELAIRWFLGEAFVDGATLVLTGAPGVGKTALLVAAAEMATTDGARMIRGGGVEYETDVSFAGLHQLVDLLSDDLRRLPRSSRAMIEVALGIGSGPAPGRLAVLSASPALFRSRRWTFTTSCSSGTPPPAARSCGTSAVTARPASARWCSLGGSRH
jgi:AAA ATPase domain